MRIRISTLTKCKFSKAQNVCIKPLIMRFSAKLTRSANFQPKWAGFGQHTTGYWTKVKVQIFGTFLFYELINALRYITAKQRNGRQSIYCWKYLPTSIPGAFMIHKLKVSGRPIEIYSIRFISPCQASSL